MPRQIRLLFPNSDIEVVATLLEKDAPATCDHVWQLLQTPQQVRVEMDHWAGGEIFFSTPPAPDLPKENMTVFPAPGDMLFYHYVGPRPRGEMVCNVGMFYRRGGKGLRKEGWIAGNVFATVTQNLAGLQAAARDVIEMGPQPMRIERVPPCPLPFLRDGVIQVGLVVEDLDKTVEAYWKLFGIGPWRIYTYRKPVLKFLNYQGRPADTEWRIALCWIGPLCIELIDPGKGENIYADFVREHGYGLHHLAAGVEDMKEAIAAAEAQGIEVTMEGGGQGLDGSGHFAYLETADKVGACIELVQYPKQRIPPDRVYP